MKDEKNSGFLGSSFTDLMASLAVIFILLTVVFIKNASEKSAKGKAIIKEELAEVLDKNKLPIEQDPNDPLSLRLRVGEDYLKFALNSSLIPDAGNQFLEQLIPQIAKALCSDSVRDKLDSILIEGHTDQSGESAPGGNSRNISLSQARALSVLVRALKSINTTPDLHSCLLKLASASGRGASHPIIQDGVYNSELSRRVEIKIRVKSSEQDFKSK